MVENSSFRAFFGRQHTPRGLRLILSIMMPERVGDLGGDCAEFALGKIRLV
jgi:hypothetical protein